MSEIKHVSFDVWGTLISANSMYALRRTQLVSEMFHLDTAVVKKAYTETKSFVDTAAEKHGVAYSTDGVFSMFFDALNLPVPLGPQSRMLMRQHFEALFRTYAPTIHEDVTPLRIFLKNRGVTMSIGSNSNFISGTVMFPFLQSELNNMFDFGVFSDLDLVAKPDTEFFDRVVIEASKDRDLYRHEILHVGDSRICDGMGAFSSGLEYALIEHPSHLYAAVRSRFM